MNVAGSQRNAAKVAALAYLISFALLVYANFGIRAEILASEDVAETIRRIAEAESLFRLSIGLDLVYCIGAIIVTSAFYVILRPVNRHIALLATVLKLVYVVTAVLIIDNLLTLSRIANDPVYSQLAPEPLHAAFRLTRDAPLEQYYVGLPFWGLSSAIFAWLWLKSRYVPRSLALFGLAGSAWCVFCAVAHIMTPAFSRAVNLWWYDMPMALFEISLGFWLLFGKLRIVDVE
jgi:hypothetical protein